MAWLVSVFYALARNGIRSPVSTHQVRMTQLPIHVGEPQEAIIAERAKTTSVSRGSRDAFSRVTCKKLEAIMMNRSMLLVSKLFGRVILARACFLLLMEKSW